MIVKPPLGSQIQLGHPLAQGLVVGWLFNEGNGVIVRDSSGNPNHGTITNAIWVAAKHGSGLYFDGTGDDVQATLPLIFTAANPISAVIMAKDLGTTVRGLLNVQGATGAANQVLCVYYDPANSRISVSHAQTSGSCRYSSAFTTSAWTHIAVTHAGGNVHPDNYLNGVLSNGAASGTLSTFGNSVLQVGKGITAAYDGLSVIDHVFLYNRVLNANETKQLAADPFAMFHHRPLELWSAAARLAGTAYVRTIDDGVGVTDAMSRACAYARILTESIGGTDSIGGVSAAIRAISDGIGLGDALSKGETKVFSDALGIVDSLIRVWEATRSFSETLGETDGLTVTKEQFRVLSDSIVVTDVPVTVSVVIRMIADTLGLGDSLSKSEAKTLDEALGLADSLSKGEGKTISDGIGVTDSLSSLWDAVRTLAEALGITDAMSEIFEGGGAFVRTINDAVGLSDSLTAVQVLLRIMSDHLGMADAVASVFAVSRIISDSEGMTDGIVLGRMISVSDSLGITDDVTRLVQYLRTQNDVEGVLDSMARVVTALRTVDDTVGMTDAMSKQFGALLKAVWAFMLLKHKR